MVCAVAFGCFSLAFGVRILVSFLFFCIHRSRFHSFVSCLVPPGSVCRLVHFFAFLFVFPRLYAVLSCSLPVLSASLSLFLRWFLVEFSGFCSLFYFHVCCLGHSLLGFIRLCLFLFCPFVCLPCDYPAYSLVTLGPFPVLLEFRTSSSDAS